MPYLLLILLLFASPVLAADLEITSANNGTAGNPTIYDGGSYDRLDVNNASYITIKNATFYSQNLTSATSWYVGRIIDSDNITIENCTFDGWDSGALNTAACSGININDSDNVSIIESDIGEVADDPIAIWGGSANLVFRGNYVHDGWSIGSDGHTSGPCVNGHTDGIEVAGVNGAVFEDNFIHIVDATSGLYITGGNNDVVVRNNVIYAPQCGFAAYVIHANDGVKIHNNTIWQAVYGGIAIDGPDVEDLHVYNNILHNIHYNHMGESQQADHYIDYNQLGETGYGYTPNTNDFVDNDPEFLNIPQLDGTEVTDPKRTDFILEATSPALAQGTTGVDVPSDDLLGITRGATPDLGAIEYTSLSSSVVYNGITWTLDDSYVTGTYVTGDPYVIAPDGLGVTAISPGPTEVSGADWNGSMLNPEPSSSQGYSELANGYSAALNDALSLPIAMAARDMLVSTTSTTSGDSTWIDIASILSAVHSAPASTSFRPGYCDYPNRTLYDSADIDYDTMLDLSAAASTPSLASSETWFTYPHIDHTLEQSWTRPGANMQAYGRDYGDEVSQAALLLNLDFTDAQKEDLTIGLAQAGIDFYSVATNGGNRHWIPDGGRHQGRKWPILFAGIVLNDATLQGIGALSGDYLFSGTKNGYIYTPPSDFIWFHEDGQTGYVGQDHIDATNSGSWNPQDPGCGTSQPYTTALAGMPEWGRRWHMTPTTTDSNWCANYRTCCSSRTFSGFVLAALFMDAKDLWNHDALFDYMDRYMAIADGDPDPFGYEVYGESSGSRGSDFLQEMWDTYRDNYTGTIEDTTPPTVTSTTPTDGATGVTLNSTVTVRMSEGLDCDTVNVGTVTMSPDTVNSVECLGFYITVPTTGQVNSTEYTVTLSTAITDDAATPNNLASQYQFSYTTVAATEVCDSDHIDLCDNETDCENAGFYWWADDCHEIEEPTGPFIEPVGQFGVGTGRFTTGSGSLVE